MKGLYSHRIRVSSIIRILLCGLLVTLGSARAQTESSDLDFARKLYDDGLYLLAADQYAEYVRDYPDSPQVARARYMVAESYFAQGDLVKADQGYRDFLRQHPQDPSVSQAWFRLGESLLRMDRREEAIAAYGHSRKIAPRGPWASRALLAMAQALRDNGQLIKALQELDDFVGQYPQDSGLFTAHFRRGQILEDLNRLDQADAAFQSAARSAETAEERSRAEYRRGRNLIRMGRQDAAIEVLERLAGTDSTSIHADSSLLILGDLCLADGQYDRAARTFTLLSDRTDDRTLAEQSGLKQAKALKLSGDPEAAMAAYRRWLNDHDGSPLRAQAQLGMADIYEQTGLPDSAAMVLEDLAREGDDQDWGTDAWLRLADLQRRMGHSERALTTYRGFMNQYPQAPQNDSIAFLMAGIQERDLARPQAALGTYRELSAGNRTGRWTEKAAFAVGRLLETTGDAEQAREAYRSFSQNYPYSPLYPTAQQRIAYLSDFRIPEEPLALEAMVDIQDQLASGILTEEEVDLRLADIYLRHLRNFDRAAAAVERFLDRHDDSELTDEALYQLSRCHALKAEMLRIDGNRTGAEQEQQAAVRACRRLLRDYPSSRWADACALSVIADIITEAESDSLPAWSERQELYESFLRTYPVSEQRPLALLRIGEALRESGEGDSLLLAQADSVLGLVVEHYPRSAWADSAAWQRMVIARRLYGGRAALAAGQDFLWEYPESPLRSRIFFLQAEIQEESGDVRQAARLYRSVAEDFAYHDLTEEAWLRQARSLWAVGEAAEAQRVLEGFARRYPESGRRLAAVLLMAQYAAARGQDDRSRALLAEVEKERGADDPDPGTQLAMGDVSRQLGDFEKAMARYRAVREAHSGRPAAQEALERMAGAAFEAGEYGQAQEYYRQALTGSADERNRIILDAGRIRCLYRQGLLPEAVRARKEFEKTYRQEGEQIAGLLLEEAQAYLDDEQQKEAEKTLGKILEDYPETLTAQEADYRLGVMLLSAGRYQEALERFGALLDRYPATDLEGQVLFKMASALYGLEQYPDAARQYRRAADRISDDNLRADALFNAGVCRARMNDWDGAISPPIVSFWRIFPDMPMFRPGASDWASHFWRPARPAGRWRPLPESIRAPTMSWAPSCSSGSESATSRWTGMSGPPRNTCGWVFSIRNRFSGPPRPNTMPGSVTRKWAGWRRPGPSTANSSRPGERGISGGRWPRRGCSSWGHDAAAPVICSVFEIPGRPHIAAPPTEDSVPNYLLTTPGEFPIIIPDQRIRMFDAFFETRGSHLPSGATWRNGHVGSGDERDQSGHRCLPGPGGGGYPGRHAPFFHRGAAPGGGPGEQGPGQRCDQECGLSISQQGHHG